jgi:DNA-binding beta-propeller fold protein YncE
MTRIAPLSGSFHPGDVSASSTGVFVSDSRSGAVYGFGKSGYSLVPLIRPGVGRSAQGTAVSPDGKRLLVADYGVGIGLVDLATRTRTLLPRQDGKSLRGVDGLAVCGSTYYGIYNGGAPGALLAIWPGETDLRMEQPLGDTSLSDPTQVAFDGKRLLIVTGSGWADIDKQPARTLGATILAVPITSACTVN